MGLSITRLCLQAFKDERIPDIIKKTHICLITKWNNATTLKNLRPINLCNTSYKIITKLIARRMSPLMSNLIEPCQSSFIKNHQAGDNAIIVQEVTNYFRKTKGKVGSFLMKIDLKKAFDKLEWLFIRHTLLYFNFSSNLVNLIMNCICSSTAAVLINGERTDFFSSTRGICQGDLTSPYIFILWMKVLSHNINEAILQKWDPIRIFRGDPPLPHLFFVDDLVLMSTIKDDSHTSLKLILSNFCTWSSQSINL